MRKLKPLDKYSHEELSDLRHEFRSIMRPSSCDGMMVSDTEAKILDSIAEEYQKNTLLAGLPEGTSLVQQRILELKERWNKEIKYPEDMETG